MHSPLSPSQKLVCCLLTISQMLLQVSSFAIHHCQCSSNSNSNSNSNSSNNNKNHFNININNINNNNNIRNTQFQLYGRKKKGNLAKNVTPGGISTKTKGTKKNKKQQQQVAQVSSSLSQWVATQDFEKDDEMENPPLESTTATTTSSSSSSSSSTKSKSKSNNNNKSQQLDYSTTTKYNTRIQSTIASIQEIISSNNFDVSKLLQYISQLVMIQNDINQDIGENNNNNNNNNNILKQLTNNQKKNNQKSKSSSSSSSSNDYTLAWVGSDDAICHVGTGLHKVPLARLQDLFMTLGGGTDTDTNTNTTPSSNLKIPQGLLKGSKKNRNSGTATMITVMEVIRILGPFPNVRNTLQGRIMNASLFKPSGGSGSNASKSTSSTAFGHSSSDNKNRKQLPISTTTNTATATRSSKVGENVVITYDSMTDGLGKEITAGNEGDTRSLGLNILFADENAVVAVVPTNNDIGDDAGDDDDELALFGTNGKNVLLFLKEEELDDKLEGLRAA